MIITSLLCLLLLIVDCLYGEKAEKVKLSLKIATLFIFPLVNILGLNELYISGYTILLTLILLHEKQSPVQKITALIPCFLFVDTQLVSFGLSLQIILLMCFYGQNKRPLDLLFGTMSLILIYIDQGVLSAALFILMILFMMIENLNLDRFLIKRALPFIGVLIAGKGVLGNLAELNTIYYIFGLVSFIAFYNMENKYKNSLLLLTYIVTTILSAPEVTNLFGLALYWYLLNRVIGDIFKLTKGVELSFIKLMSEFSILNPVMILALVLSSGSSIIIGTIVLISSLSVFSSKSFKVNQKQFLIELSVLLLILVVMVPFNHFPTKFMFLVNEGVLTGAQWEAAATITFYSLILIAGLFIYFHPKFEDKISGIIFRFVSSNKNRSTFLTSSLNKTFTGYTSLQKRNTFKLDRPLALEGLLLISNTIKNKYEFILWILVVILVSTVAFI